MNKFLFLTMMVFVGTAYGGKNHGAHVHGVGQLSLAFDGMKGKIQLEAPAEALFGFEHDAKSKKDLQRKDAALKKLEEKISEMIVFEESLKCLIKKDIFEVNQTKSHADVEAEFSITCEKSVQGSSIEFHFQKVFPNLKNVKVDVLVNDLQKSIEVKKNGESIGLK